MANQEGGGHSPFSVHTEDADEKRAEAQRADPPPAQPRPKTFCEESKEKVNVAFFLSILSVACWALAGNAARLALHSAFLSIPFFSTYELFGPNCIGSFAMGLVVLGLPPEAELPIVHRALGVGFCGSFTTFSSWVVDIANKGSAGGAFEELISGVTMPFVFFLWGGDAALGLRWLVGWLPRRCGNPEEEEEERGTASAVDGGKREKKATVYHPLEYVFLALSCAAAVAVPIGVQVRINQGHIHSVTSAGIEAVALGPAGAVVRFLLSVFLNKRSRWGEFPVGTLAANTLGVFLVVFMDNYAHHRPGNRWFWVVANGVCGALSTVSSFMSEVVGFHRGDRLRMAYAYALITLAVTITIGAVGRRGNFA